MQGSEARALGDLAAAGVSEGTRLIEDLHRAIAGRTFGATRAGAAPVRSAHDTITTGVYAGVRLAAGALLRAAGTAAAATRGDDGPSLADHPRGGQLLAAISGIWGDRLERDASPLALRTTLRHDGRDLPPEPGALARAFPQAGRRVAVFVHGLCETEAAWSLYPAAHPDRPGASYGSLLREDLGVEPLYVRYNSGLALAHSGAELAGLLERLVAAWPGGLDELILIGHSMGGLVICHACEHGRHGGDAWPSRVGHVVYLGSPHGGAPLEKGAELAVEALGRLGETRPIASIIGARSQGIRDLREGCPDLTPLECARHHHISASLEGALGVALGDGLVRRASARGRALDAVHLRGLSHFHLLNHADVYAILRERLAAPARGGPPAPQRRRERLLRRGSRSISRPN